MFVGRWEYPSAGLVLYWAMPDPHNGIPGKYRKMRNDWWETLLHWQVSTDATDTDG